MMAAIILTAALGLVSPHARAPSVDAAARSRRAFASAFVSTAALGLAAPAHAYRSVQQAMEDTRQVSQASLVYARFSVIQERMKQLGEFAELAEKGEWESLQAFARNFNQLVQNDEMLKIVDAIGAESKEDAKKYAELVRNDLKAIDKAARQKDVDKVKEIVGILTGNLDAFLKLRPAELVQKYSVPDL